MAYVRTYAKRGSPRWRYPTISNRSLKATTVGPAIIGKFFYYEFICAMNKIIDEEDKFKHTIQNGTNYVNQSLITEYGSVYC